MDFEVIKSKIIINMKEAQECRQHFLKVYRDSHSDLDKEHAEFFEGKRVGLAEALRCFE